MTTTPNPLSCRCPAVAAGPWDCLGCPVHGQAAEDYLADLHRAEIEAENGWLRAAEAGYPGYDYDPNEAFDPQINVRR